MTILNFTNFDLNNPGGANGLSSLAMYFQRLLYKQKIYPPNLFTPLDTWYNKLYYGRVDQQQNTVIPDISNLSSIKTTARNNLFALNFVVEAFEDFASHMKNARILGVLRENGNNKIFDMKAYKAYQDPTVLYDEYLQQLFDSFRKSVLMDTSNKITNFKTFVEVYTDYIKKVTAFIPTTKTNYLLTNVGNVMNSGLSIAIDNGPADNDEYKYENFIKDPNFNFYVRAAKKFGFTVNKNIPWVLTADLFSDAALKYIARYVNDEGVLITKTNFFDSYYKKTYLTDITDLRKFIVNSYNSFIEYNPFYEERKYYPNCDKYTVENRTRSPIAPAAIADILNDKRMCDLYLELRGLESQNSVQITKKLRVELANIYTLQPNNAIDKLQNAAQYINLVYRDYIYTVDYLFLNDLLLKEPLDNQALTGKIATAGSITQQLY